MQKEIKILTFIFCLTNLSFASVITQEKFKTHLRWKIKSPKSELETVKTSEALTIKVKGQNLFFELQKEAVGLPSAINYIQSMKFENSNQAVAEHNIKLSLADKSVEHFSFYKEDEKAFIIDFWINPDLVEHKKTLPKVAKVERPKVQKVSSTMRAPVIKKSTPKVEVEVSRLDDSLYRDFRYGSAFLWDLDAQVPRIEKDVNLYAKAPNYLYSIKDRDLSKGDKESHLQLTINFYRKSQWGLMAKSLALYESKYGNHELNDFMKAVSLVKNQIKPRINNDELQSKGTFASALNILKRIAAQTKNYELKQACLRYVLQASVDKDDFINSLHYAKALYVLGTEAIEDETIIYSSKVILKSLAELKQINKIDEFLKNKAVMRVLPRQLGFAYKSYVYLATGKEEKIISEFEARKSAMKKPVEETILFNLGEAYYRQGQFLKAKQTYAQYLESYAHTPLASKVRIRSAVVMDLMDEKFAEVSEAYKKAINLSADPASRYEAKIRYVGHGVIRKKELTEDDLEKLVFLDQSEEEKNSMNKNLSKLLWLTRLRSFIVQEKYNDALAYFKTVPLFEMSMMDKQTFEADGADLVLGLVKQAYLAEDYTKAIKVWNIYRPKYLDKVAKSLYLRFLVTDSYLRLGLTKSFEDSYEELKSLKSVGLRNYPEWVTIHKNFNQQDFNAEIEISKLVKEKDWKALQNFIAKLDSKSSINQAYYRGLVAFANKDYSQAVKNYQEVIVSPLAARSLSPKENLTMQEQYVEALYEEAKPEKFRKHTKAILADIRNSASPNLPLIERAEYLVIESLFDEKKEATEVSLRTKDFITEFKESPYLGRVKFIRAINYLKLNKVGEGKNLLEEILKEKNTPEYIRGLARSELTGLVLADKKI